MKLFPEEPTANVVYQIGALKGFLERESVELYHVKPHGILYGMMVRDMGVARAVWAGYYGDVKYCADGTLIVDCKKQPWKIEDVKTHVTKQLEESKVVAVTGEEVSLPVKDYPITICCHSDSPGCIEIVSATREVVDRFNKERGL